MLDIILTVVLIFGALGVGYIYLVKNQNYQAQKNEIFKTTQDQNKLQNGQTEEQEQQQRQQQQKRTGLFGSLGKFAQGQAQAQEQVKAGVQIFNNLKGGNIKGAAHGGFDLALKMSPFGHLSKGLGFIPPNPVTSNIKTGIDTAIRHVNPMSWF